MRDLSRSFYKKDNIGKRRLFRILAIIVVISAAIYLARNFLGTGGGGASGVTLKDAPFGLTPVNVSPSAISGSGVTLASEKATLKDVKYGGDAFAVATRSYGGGIYRLEVTATLPDPKNVAYMVWLVGANGPLAIDIMKGSGTSWSLSLSDTDKFSSYRGIWITLERNKADAIVEEHVMEGSF